MNDSEKKSSQNQDHEPNQGRPGRGPEQWANCCHGIGKTDSGIHSDIDMQHAMAKCFSCCRYFLLVPIVLGISFLLFGYYLSPDVIRSLWMIGAGVAVGMGLIGALVMRRFATGSSFFGCCGAWPKRKN
ncbi:hypothetical protein ACFL6U_25925 [Planctomycetota bacterium]